MKTLLSVAAAAALFATAGIAEAGKPLKQIGKGAEQVGRTVKHGAKSVGRGASKVYHEGAKGVHKTISKNTKSERTEAAHFSKAAGHKAQAVKDAKKSEKAMDKASHEAGKVTTPPK